MPPQQGMYGGQPAGAHLVPQQTSVSLADAVQAAHGEGFNFGQAVARDAPAPGTTEYSLTPLSRTGGPKLVVIPLSERTGYALELRNRGGNDEVVCRPGVLIYKIDADVDTGLGPVTVYDSHPDSGGCTSSPNVHAELSDAPLAPGEVFKDARRGIRVTVTAAADLGGNYRVLVTRR